MKSTAGWRDWALLAVCMLFLLAALLAPSGKRDTVIVVSVMFGLAGLVPASRIVRSFRARRLVDMSAVSVPGNVPIRPSPLRTALFAAGGLVFGVVLLVYGHQMPRWFHWLGWAITVAAGFLLAGVASGVVPREYLVFREEGLVFGHGSWQVLVPWDTIRIVQAGEYHNNPALFLWLASPDDCIVTPAGKKKALARRLRQSLDWIGCDIFLLTTFYSVDLPVLLAAIERYRGNSAARRELAVPVLPSRD